MAKQVNMHGARAKFGVLDKRTGKISYVGIFDSVNVSQNYEAVPAFILGRVSAATITYVAADVISLSCSGWRVIGNGRFKGGKMPKLQDLLEFESLVMTVEDRQTDDNGENPRALTVRDVYPTSSSEGFSARELSKITMSYIGIAADDESTQNVEAAGASTII